MLKRERGVGVVDSWFCSLWNSGFIPMSVIEDVYSRTLLTYSDSLESASCPSVASPSSIFWKLAEETGHLCKKVVLMLWLKWLKKVFTPTVEPFYHFTLSFLSGSFYLAYNIRKLESCFALYIIQQYIVLTAKKHVMLF